MHTPALYELEKEVLPEGGNVLNSQDWDLLE